MTPIARELLAPSLNQFGRSSTLPAEAYTDWSVFRWEQEHFFDESWVCVGRSDGLANQDAQRRRGVARLALRQRRRRSAPVRGARGQSGGFDPEPRLRGSRRRRPPRLQIAANWKILAENYHECYHCSSIHPELCEVSPPTSGGDNLEPEGAWIGGPMDLYEGVETMSLDGKSHAPMLPDLAEGQDRTVHYFQLFPNLLISPHPDYVMTHRLLPLAPEPHRRRMRVALLPRSRRAGALRPLLRQRLLGHHQPPGLARLRVRPARRLLARLPPRAPLAPRGRRLPAHHHGGQRLPRRRGRTPKSKEVNLLASTSASQHVSISGLVCSVLTLVRYNVAAHIQQGVPARCGSALLKC